MVNFFFPQLVAQTTYSLFIPQPQMTMQHWPSVIANLKVQISLIVLPLFLLVNMFFTKSKSNHKNHIKITKLEFKIIIKIFKEI